LLSIINPLSSPGRPFGYIKAILISFVKISRSESTPSSQSLKISKISLTNIIFGFTFISKKGKKELCRKKTTGFTLILIRGTRGWRRKEARKGGNSSPSFITCRSKYFSTTTIKTVTAVYLSRLEELLTQIELGGDPEAEADSSSTIGEKDL
jgi:hypothetical protein